MCKVPFLYGTLGYWLLDNDSMWYIRQVPAVLPRRPLSCMLWRRLTRTRSNSPNSGRFFRGFWNFVIVTFNHPSNCTTPTWCTQILGGSRKPLLWCWSNWPAFQQRRLPVNHRWRCLALLRGSLGVFCVGGGVLCNMWQCAKAAGVLCTGCRGLEASLTWGRRIWSICIYIYAGELVYSPPFSFLRASL